MLSDDGLAPMDMANYNNDSYTPMPKPQKEIAALLRTHGGKTMKELKAEGK